MDKVREILKPILLVCMLFSVSTAMAQGAQVKTLFSIKNKNTIAPQCFSDELHDNLMRNDAEYKLRHESMERQVQLAIENETGTQRDEILTIPLVVHVIHTGESVGVGSNISDEQIYSAVNGLNEDFREMSGTNGDGSGVDSEIEFCLAVRDPNGNPTNGINRVNGSSVTNYASMGIAGNPGTGANEQDVKNLSKWSKWDYYNIWIVNEIADNDGGSGIQGYAYFASAGPAVDGAVILHNAFGTVGNLKGYTNMNRVVTHEVGHALNLYHTFQGNNCTETDCTSEGDRVCDTPPTTNNNNCNAPACGGTQQVENYMDYTSQTCKDMFTAGQKVRMRAALTTQRSTLLASAGCSPVSQYDVGLDEIISPNGNACSETISPIVKVRNYGGSTINSVTINYGIDGNNSSSFNYTGSIASGASQEIVLPAISTGVGSHSFTASTSSPNGQTDEFPSNDGNTSSFSIVTGSTLTVTVRQDTYGSNTTWDLKDANGNIVSQDGPYENGQSGTIHTRQICLPEGCYEFTIYDSYGDGLIGSAFYEVTDSESGLIVTGSDFGSIETTNFCTSGSSGGGTAPTAQFSANMTTACIGEAINFTDMSSGVPTSWVWNFEGAVSSTSTNQSPSNIIYNVPGTYNVTLTTSNASGSSTETKTNYITIGDGPTINGSVTNVLCHGGSDGAISLTVSGGLPGYSYSWSNGLNSASISGLSSGTYSVLVTDGNGCESLNFYTVEEPSEIQVTIANITHDVDNGGVGSASININGGIGSYEISWSNGAYGNSISNLHAGSYTATVTDNNGCAGSLTIDISNQDSGNINPPIANFDVSDSEICSTNSVNFTDLSTNSPTAWAWDFEGGIPSNSSNMNPSGIRYDQPGNYNVTLTVTNAYGSDTKVEMNYIHSMESPNIVTGISEISCANMQDGSIDLTVSAGQAPFVYNWSNGSATEDIYNLGEGNYTVSVTDANGCINSSVVMLQQPSPILISAVGNMPDSCGLGQGTVTVIPSGGTPEYSIAWNDANQQTGGVLINVVAGSYVAVVTDAHACTKGITVEIGDIDCGTVGIDELSIEDVNIYPNPFDGFQVNISYNSSNSISAHLFNLTGAEIPVGLRSNGANNYVISANDQLSNGIYMLKLIDGDQSIIKKLIVRH